MSERAHIKALTKERVGLWTTWTSAEGRLAWSYLRQHWQRLVNIIAMAFASSWLELLRMGLILSFLGAGPAWTTARLPAFASQQNILLTGIIVVSLISAVWDWWRRHVALEVQQDFIEALRADVCLTMLKRPLDWFTANPAGQASYLLNGQVQRFGTLVPMASEAAAAILQGGAVAALMLWTSVPLTAIALSGSALLWVVLRPLQRRIRTLSVEVSVDSGRAAAKAEECAYAIKLIKSCRTEGYERDRYAALARELAQKQVRLADLRNLASGLTMIGFVGILGAAVIGWGLQRSDIGPLTAYGILLLRLYPCLSKLIEARTSLATMAGHMAAVAEFMAVQPTLEERTWVTWEKERYIHQAFDIVAGTVATKGLGLFYTSNKPVLRDVTLEVRKGQATALVGLTGSGKSSLFDILAGLRSPSVGIVSKIDGKVGYLTQESILMFGTVSDNAQYGGPEHSDLTKDYSCWPKFPKAGIDGATHVGKAGSALSGGQKQLVAMLRVIRSDTQIWLLDEPTSSMDAETERAVLDVIKIESRDRVVLMATHRLAVASQLPRILVLHGGRIVQDGAHEQLVKEDGLYQRLWRLQEVAQ